jgi:hypothetical protein
MKSRNRQVNGLDFIRIRIKGIWTQAVEVFTSEHEQESPRRYAAQRVGMRIEIQGMVLE